MLTKYLLPLLAIAGVWLAVYTVMAQNKPTKVTPPVAQPASAPYASQVPGAGLVEPSTEFIEIGTSVPGIVTGVYVKANDRVKASDPLFSIDDRTLRAELQTREAAVAVAQAQLEKLIALPRPEDLPALEAALRGSKSQLDDLKVQLTMWENLPDKRAVSAEELSRRRFSVAVAEARLEQINAELEQTRAGAWKPDLDISRANLASARADADRVRTEIERLTVRAPVDADILKVNVRVGEYAQAGAMAQPLMVIGETRVMHIRVDIAENDAWRVKPGAKGKAYIRGNANLKTDIRFVRFEPYVIPKRSLTGASSERVDTRVLQVIYAFDHSDLPMVFVGQQMDVFLDAPPIGDAKFGADSEQAARDLAK